MRAICATPASPQSENDFFRNQTGKLGLNHILRLSSRGHPQPRNGPKAGRTPPPPRPGILRAAACGRRRAREHRPVERHGDRDLPRLLPERESGAVLAGGVDDGLRIGLEPFGGDRGLRLHRYRPIEIAEAARSAAQTWRGRAPLVPGRDGRLHALARPPAHEPHAARLRRPARPTSVQARPSTQPQQRAHPSFPSPARPSQALDHHLHSCPNDTTLESSRIFPTQITVAKTGAGCRTRCATFMRRTKDLRMSA